MPAALGRVWFWCARVKIQRLGKQSVYMASSLHEARSAPAGYNPSTRTLNTARVNTPNAETGPHRSFQGKMAVDSQELRHDLRLLESAFLNDLSPDLYRGVERELPSRVFEYHGYYSCQLQSPLRKENMENSLQKRVLHSSSRIPNLNGSRLSSVLP